MIIPEQKNMKLEDHQLLHLKKFAIHFLTNFFDIYDINKPFFLDNDKPNESFKLSFDVEKNESEHKKYTECYQSYIL